MTDAGQRGGGGLTDAESATVGSYGEAPSGHRLPAATRLGRVQLQVADLDRSLRFYVRMMGLRVLAQDASHAMLAARDDARVLLELRTGARAAAAANSLGLFHFAVLLPDRASLGRFARHLSGTGTPAGSADHLVSEAFYLTDPDGLGIEVYADRPQERWRRRGRELVITTEPLDVDGLVEAAGTDRWTGMPAGTVIGHIHLRVGDLEQAFAYFSSALGFDLTMWRYPGALFFGAGGYHHHVATNIWAGAGARPPAAEDPQLLEWTLELPTPADVRDVGRSLTGAGFVAERMDDGVVITRDPWGTPIRISARSAAA